MKQRLQVLIKTQGSNFNFSKTILGFKNDPEFRSLRYNHGLRNIAYSGATTEPGRKRKYSDRTRKYSDRTRKYIGRNRQYMEPMVDEFHFTHWSDMESSSGFSTAKYNWQLAVVKTRLYTSPSNITQLLDMEGPWTILSTPGA
jgi:hypothetical protein